MIEDSGKFCCAAWLPQFASKSFVVPELKDPTSNASKRRHINMAKKMPSGNRPSAEPRVHQRGRELQQFGTVTHAFNLELEEPVRLEMTEQLNQLLADSMTLRDLYKKSHWQVAGP